MNDEFADIWQEQRTPEIVTSVDEIRERATRLKKRMEFLHRGSVLVWLMLLTTAVADLLFFDDSLTRWLDAARFVLYTLVVICTPQIFRKKTTLRTASRSTSCLEFYRKELEYRAEDLKTGMKVALVMFFVGLTFALSGTRGSPWPRILAGSTVVVSSSVWYVRMKREAPQVRIELEDLNASVPRSDQESGA
jgi:hypothetical protein